MFEDLKKHLKKLTVLVLVAVQLVSAFAFGASAAVILPYLQFRRLLKFRRA